MKNVEIRKTKKLKDGTVKIDLAFEVPNLGNIVIKGFRVRESQYKDGPWVQEPSYQVYGQYHGCFFMEDRQKWEELKTLLQKEHSNYVDENETANEDIDPKEIPF